MGVNSLPKTVTRQRRDCDLNLGLTAPESSMLTTQLPSHRRDLAMENNCFFYPENRYSSRHVVLSLVKRKKNNNNSYCFLTRAKKRSRKRRQLRRRKIAIKLRALRR